MTGVVLVVATAWLRSRWALWAAAALIAVVSVALEHAGWLWGIEGPRASGWPSEVLHPVIWVLTVPDLLTVAVAVVGLGGLAVRALDHDRSIRPLPPAPALAPVALLLLAVMAGPLVRDMPRMWNTIGDGSAEISPVNLISPGALAYLNAHERTPFPVVLAPWDGPTDGLAYQIVGQSDTYTVALNEPHTRATPRDHPQARRALVTQFFDPATTADARDALLSQQNVGYVVLDRRTADPAVLAQLQADPRLTEVYADPAGLPARYGRVVIFKVAP